MILLASLDEVTLEMESTLKGKNLLLKCMGKKLELFPMKVCLFTLIPYIRRILALGSG